MPVNDFPATVREVLRSHLTKRAIDINPMLLGAGAGAVTGAVLPAEKAKDRLYHALLGAGAGGLGGLGVGNQMPSLFKSPPGGDMIDNMIDKLNGAMNGKPQG